MKARPDAEGETIMTPKRRLLGYWGTTPGVKFIYEIVGEWRLALVALALGARRFAHRPAAVPARAAR